MTEMDTTHLRQTLCSVGVDATVFCAMKHYASSPDVFIWLLHPAAMSVFSITSEKDPGLFKRNQAVFEDVYSRLHNPLELLPLMEPVCGRGYGLDIELSSKAKAKLKQEHK